MRQCFLVALSVFVLAVVALAAGASFDLDPFDSAELALVAVTGGLGHPPGQPLHTVLGWVITRGPWRPLTALTFLSLLPAAGVLSIAAMQGMREAFVSPTKKVRTSRMAMVVGIGLLAALLPSVRDVACRVEVYALAAVLSTAAVIVAMGRSPRCDFVSGLFLGLAAATNPVVALQGAGAVWVAMVPRRRAFVAVLVRMAFGSLVGLCVYVYAWAVAPREGVTLVWGAPTDLRSLFVLLTARDFQRNVSLSIGTLSGHFVRLGWDLVGNGTLPYLALGAFGLWFPIVSGEGRAVRSPFAIPMVIAFGFGAVMIASNVPYRSGNPDYGGYLMVPIALGYVGASRFVLAGTRIGSVLCLVVLSALFAVPSVVVRGRPAGVTRVLATEVLASAPSRALLVLESDHLLFPVLYLQRVEGVRPDVTVLNPGWASSGWAWRHARARDPSLIVDLTPGLGGWTRLVRTLRAREPVRAVMTESLALLQSVAPGPVCPRGILWVSHEGCSAVGRQVERTVQLLRNEARRARTGSWDARIVLLTARTLGDGALSLGCPGLALRYYSAGLGEPSPVATGRMCDGRPVTVPPGPGLLEIVPDDLHRAMARVRGVP